MFFIQFVRQNPIQVVKMCLLFCFFSSNYKCASAYITLYSFGLMCVPYFTFQYTHTSTKGPNTGELTTSA